MCVYCHYDHGHFPVFAQKPLASAGADGDGDGGGPPNIFDRIFFKDK